MIVLEFRERAQKANQHVVEIRLIDLFVLLKDLFRTIV